MSAAAGIKCRDHKIWLFLIYGSRLTGVILEVWSNFYKREMKKLALKILGLWLLIAPGILFAGHEVIFSDPKCASSKSPSFCTLDDASRIKSEGLVKKRLQGFLFQSTQNPIDSVKIAHYIFDDIDTADYLCEQYSKARFKLKIYEQFSHRPRGSYVKIRNKLRECFTQDVEIKSIGTCDFMTERNKCNIDVINTMHLKIIEITRKTGETQTVTSSGNLGKGMFANLEDWIFIDEKDDNSSKIHSCLWEQLESLAIAAKTNAAIRENYTNCLENKNNYTNGVAIQFLPAQTLEFYNSFAEHSRNASSILIFSMDFSDKRLYGAVKSAALHGAKITIIADDDWYYSTLQRKAVGNSSKNDPKLSEELFSKHPDKVTLKYIETNHYISPFLNTVHHKMVVFKNKKGETTVLTGSLNLNPGAIKNNIDAAYWITNRELTDSYLVYTRKMEAQARNKSDMPKIAPEPPTIK